MLFRIVIEIVNVDSAVPNWLILKGYKLSKYGAVAFILNNIKPSEINKILNPIVPKIGLDIPGVKYISIDAHEDIRIAISSAKLIITHSCAFGDIVKCMSPVNRYDSWLPSRQMPVQNDRVALAAERNHSDLGVLRIHKAASRMTKTSIRSSGSRDLLATALPMA